MSDSDPKATSGADPDREPPSVVDVYASVDLERTRGRVDASAGLPAIGLPRSSALELAPLELAARRRNRRWMVGLAVPSLIVLVLALVATAVASSNEPSGPAQSAPPGYQTQNDGHFSYFVPKSWSNNPEFTDAAGDVETSGPSGFVGENIAYRPDPPTLGEAQPASLRSFGVPSPQPYSLTGGHAIAVPGAPTSYQYTVTRPGGFHAVAVDSWDPTDGVELWLLTEGPPAVTTQLISSLRAR